MVDRPRIKLKERSSSKEKKSRLLLSVSCLVCKATAFTTNFPKSVLVQYFPWEQQSRIVSQCSLSLPGLQVPKEHNQGTFCRLVPLRIFQDELLSAAKFECFDNGDRNSFLSTYEVGLVEENDLLDVSRFIVQNFGVDAINLNSNFSQFERMIMSPAVELVNGYSGVVAFAEVLAGLRGRLRLRINGRTEMQPPNLRGLSRREQIIVASSSSVVLAVVKNDLDHRKNRSIVASVELRLSICDAKIPFAWPWLDMIERSAAYFLGLNNSSVENDLQPYLCNLCVDESHRGKGLGRALVKCVERIASTKWGYNRLYLHVDTNNIPALELYKSEGYTDGTYIP